MRFGRSLPPAAAPLGPRELAAGMRGILAGRRELHRFQSELKHYFGAKHCFLLSSGKAAFALILMALKELHPDRDEVLVPAFTCYSVPASVRRAALRIRLCDLRPETFDFDFIQLSAMLSARAGSRILAVVPTHLFGIPADVLGLRKLVQDPDITVVEDAAQAMGEAMAGRKAGTHGDVGFFSLGRGKALTTVEGGVILTDRDDIAAALHRQVEHLTQYSLPQLGVLILKAAALMILTHPLVYWIPQSLSFLKLGQTFYEPEFPMMSMSSFQAGLTAGWRERLEEFRESRRQNVARWTAVLRDSDYRESLLRISPSTALLRFPLSVRDPQKRKSLLRESELEGLGIMAAYPESINRIPGLGISATFPVAEGLSRQLVTLPTHRFVSPKDVTVIGNLLAREES